MEKSVGITNTLQDKVKCKEEIREFYKKWATEFYVCETHKKECFADFEFAVVKDDAHCVLCTPSPNDAMGG